MYRLLKINTYRIVTYGTPGLSYHMAIYYITMCFLSLCDVRMSLCDVLLSLFGVLMSLCDVLLSLFGVLMSLCDVIHRGSVSGLRFKKINQKNI